MTYESMLAETVAVRASQGDVGEAYYARPLGGGPWPGVVLIHHMPGWDEWIMEATRKLAHHGYARRSRRTSISATAPAAPTTSGARARGRRRRRRAGDGRRRGLRSTSARAALCQRQGRRDRLLLGRAPRLSRGLQPVAGIDAVVDCWGGNVVVDDPKLLDAKRPVAPIDLTEKLTCPLLGMFGNDDQNPNRDHVNRTEAGAQEARQDLRVPPLRRLPATPSSTPCASAYRPEQALDGWNKVFAFFRKHLATPAAARAA